MRHRLLLARGGAQLLLRPRRASVAVVVGAQQPEAVGAHERFHDLKGRRNLAQSFRFFHYHAHAAAVCWVTDKTPRDRKSTRLNSSHTVNSYAVFCLKK